MAAARYRAWLKQGMTIETDERGSTEGMWMSERGAASRAALNVTFQLQRAYR
jgi:hypothetical protein